jgi:hypothetical protein
VTDALLSPVLAFCPEFLPALPRVALTGTTIASSFLRLNLSEHVKSSTGHSPRRRLTPALLRAEAHRDERVPPDPSRRILGAEEWSRDDAVLMLS